MNIQRKFKIIICETSTGTEWELLESHGHGEASDVPEAHSDAEFLRRELLEEGPPITSGAVAPNQTTPMVNQELTKEQRETLYRIVYDSHRYCYKGDDESISDDPIPEHDYMKLLAKLSE